MSIIDFHTHIYPEKIAAKAVASVSDFYTLDMTGEGTSENLVKIGSKCGITGYVVHSVAVTEAHVQTINNFIASECEKHKEFYGFGTMHADFKDKIAEIDRLTGMGLVGVKIHPDTQKFNMDDERMFEMYDYLRQKRIPVLIHCGDYRYDYSHPRRLKRILKEFPGLITIGAHFGGWSIFDLAYEFLCDEKCFLDTSSSFAMLGMKRSKELIRLYGAERMLFGTDYPMWNTESELDRLLSMNLSNEENELILYKNAERILGITE